MVAAHFARGATHRIGAAALHTLELTLAASLPVRELADYALPAWAAYARSVVEAFHFHRC